ncbi:tyrosine-type recombinase/integrase [Corynebacterium xerosis]|uniref:tyrosine-type recombinase/integrase n=1 Tax=Corynebacterium xerosis TaxID=1725 RepID=UPI0036723E75
MSRDIPHGSVEKRGSRYRATYYDPAGTLTASGRPRKVYSPMSFTARADAEAWLIAEYELIRWGNWQHPKDRAAAKARTATTLDDYLDRFIAARGYRPSTEATMRSVYKTRIKPHLGDRPLADLTAPDVKAWQAALKADPATSATLKRNRDAFAMLSTMFTQAVEHGLVEVNPCSGVKVRKPKADAKTVPTVEQVTELIGLMPEHYRLPTALMAWSGLRVGEVAGLQRADAYAVTTGGQTVHYVHVRRTVQRVAGEWITTPGKTEEARRRVPVPPHIVPFLVWHLQRYTADAADAPLCVNKDGGMIVRQRYARVLADRAGQVGCPDLTPHVLRHFAATQYARMGAGVPDLQAWLGHADPAMSLHYAKAANGRAEQLAAAMSALATGESA